MSREDEKFASFLKENRPQTPQAPIGESDRIWRAIEANAFVIEEPELSRPAGRRRLSWPSLTFGLSTMAMAIVAALTFWNTSGPGSGLVFSGPVEGAADFEGEAIEQALELEFMENGELEEVTTLVSAVAGLDMD